MYVHSVCNDDAKKELHVHLSVSRRRSSCATYLDVVLACWGTERMPMYKVSRYKEPLVIQAPKLRRTLDEVVTEAERD